MNRRTSSSTSTGPSATAQNTAEPCASPTKIVGEQGEGAGVGVLAVGVGTEHPVADEPDEERHGEQAEQERRAADDELAPQPRLATYVSRRRVSGSGTILGRGGGGVPGVGRPGMQYLRALAWRAGIIAFP